jgi:hypothetical protein
VIIARHPRHHPHPSKHQSSTKHRVKTSFSKVFIHTLISINNTDAKAQTNRLHAACTVETRPQCPHHQCPERLELPCSKRMSRSKCFGMHCAEMTACKQQRISHTRRSFTQSPVTIRSHPLPMSKYLPQARLISSFILVGWQSNHFCLSSGTIASSSLGVSGSNSSAEVLELPTSFKLIALKELVLLARSYRFKACA